MIFWFYSMFIISFKIRLRFVEQYIEENLIVLGCLLYLKSSSLRVLICLLRATL